MRTDGINFRGDFVNHHESLDLVEVQGGYGENVQRFEAQEEWSH
jgi:hypothetical protein